MCAQSCLTLLRPYGLQHTRLPCPSPSPRLCSNSCPLSRCILCRPLLLLPSMFPSTRVFPNELARRIRWPTYWSFCFSPSNEYSEFISFGIDWFNLLAVQRTLQHHNSKAQPSLWSNSHIHT